MSTVELTIHVPQGAERVPVLGVEERNLKMIREALGVNIAARDGAVRVKGDPRAVEAARRVLERLDESAKRGAKLSRHDVLELVAESSSMATQIPDDLTVDIAERREQRLGDVWDGPLDVYVRGRRVDAKSQNQRHYIEAIKHNDLVLCSGPAGTGKTYIAVAAAVHMLKAGAIRRIVLVRPAVEAGEKLGFLPGDLEAKVNPYLRPLLDALHDMMDFGTLKRFMINDVIEVAPLAFMRGRTLNDAVIILDEAQNTTRGQMKMFLTRLGQRSKMIVTGDTTQIDLPDPRESRTRRRRPKRLSQSPGRRTDRPRRRRISSATTSCSGSSKPTGMKTRSHRRAASTDLLRDPPEPTPPKRTSYPRSPPSLSAASRMADSHRTPTRTSKPAPVEQGPPRAGASAPPRRKHRANGTPDRAAPLRPPAGSLIGLVFTILDRRRCRRGRASRSDSSRRAQIMTNTQTRPHRFQGRSTRSSTQTAEREIARQRATRVYQRR